MKSLVLAGLLVGAPLAAFAQTPADIAATAPSAFDWSLDPGWTWNDGAITHWNSRAGAAQPVAMGPIVEGRTYRVMLKLSGRTRGSLTIALGGDAARGYGPKDGIFTLYPTVTDASKPLTLTATADFDGSVSDVRVVELGPELASAGGWSLGAGWSQASSALTFAGGAASTVQKPVDVTAGRTYQVRFHVGGLTQDYTGPESAAVTLAGSTPGPFGPRGDWNYAYDLQAGDTGTLVFSPRAVEGAELFSGTLSAVTVREITSDDLMRAVPPPAPVQQ